MIGNETDAAAALAGTLAQIGGGHTRIAYLSDKNVVYKVCAFDDHDANLREYRAGEVLRGNLPSPLVVPEMTLYPNGVLAMEYVDGEYMGECYCLPGESHMGCLPFTTVKILNTISLDCATWGNTCMRDGILYLIDLA